MSLAEISVASGDNVTLQQMPWDSPQCKVGYFEYIVIDGIIRVTTKHTIRKILDSKPNGCVVLVSLNSPGGDQASGAFIGRYFRRHNVETRIQGSNRCASACALAFLGGSIRTMEDGARLVVHAPYSEVYNKTTKQRKAICSKGRNNKHYYTQVLGPQLAERLVELEMQFCGRDKGYEFTPEEARAWGLLTQ